jgi:hypothetical protein
MAILRSLVAAPAAKKGAEPGRSRRLAFCHCPLAVLAMMCPHYAALTRGCCWVILRSLKIAGSLIPRVEIRVRAVANIVTSLSQCGSPHRGISRVRALFGCRWGNEWTSNDRSNCQISAECVGKSRRAARSCRESRVHAGSIRLRHRHRGFQSASRRQRAATTLVHGSVVRRSGTNRIT